MIFPTSHVDLKAFFIYCRKKEECAALEEDKLKLCFFCAYFHVNWARKCRVLSAWMEAEQKT